MTNKFIPEIWSKGLLDALHAQSFWLTLGNRRKGHSEPVVLSDGEKAERKRRYDEWWALTQELEDAGILERFEDSIDFVETPRATWVYDETEEEYQARIAAEE